MKVLIVCPFPPWETGGVERVIGEISKRLIKSYDIQIYCSSLKDASGDFIWNDIPIKVYKSKNWIGNTSIKMYKDLKKHANEFNVIHAHNFGSLIPLVTSLSYGSTPLILSAHYHPKGATITLQCMKKIHDCLFANFVFSKSKKIVCVSKTEKEIIQKIFKISNEKISIIPNGVNVRAIYNAIPYQFNGKLILCVGRLMKHKNIHFVVRAMKYLPENYYFYIIGNRGTYGIKLDREIRKLKLAKRVKILSSVSDEGVHRWLKTCSAFINLSEIEAFGITVLEALAADKPVIVNNKLGLAELANKFKGAVFPIDVEKTDPRDFAEIIKEMSNKTIEKVDLREFDWDYIAKKVANLYAEINGKE